LEFLFYVSIAVAFAVYLISRACVMGINDFQNAALAALIAVIGTGLTACASVYAAIRQALASHEVEISKLQTGTQLAEFNANLTEQIEGLKAQSAQSLER
jgi:hypothetical protein